MQCHILTSKTVIWIKTTPGKYYLYFCFISAMFVELLKARSQVLQKGHYFDNSSKEKILKYVFSQVSLNM